MLSPFNVDFRTFQCMIDSTKIDTVGKIEFNTKDNIEEFY
jgi:hypothetical protein